MNPTPKKLPAFIDLLLLFREFTPYLHLVHPWGLGGLVSPNIQMLDSKRGGRGRGDTSRRCLPSDTNPLRRYGSVALLAIIPL